MIGLAYIALCNKCIFSLYLFLLLQLYLIKKIIGVVPVISFRKSNKVGNRKIKDSFSMLF